VQREVVAVGVPESRTRVINAVIDDSRFATADATMAADLRAEFALPPGAPLVGTVGALEHHKGHHTLIDAWPRVLQASPDAALIIVGDGPQHEALRERARALGVQHRVFLPGHRTDIPSVLAALDLFVLPSLIEGMPGALLETMLSGLPCVATDCPGSEELIDDGRTGLIVPREDVSAWGDAITRLLADAPLRQQMASAGPGIVRGGFLPSHMIDATLALYTNLLAQQAANNGRFTGGG
jgi:glycosyltransferase involved in cell wall biosynthesis